MSEDDAGFLSRWSRRKARVQSGLGEPAELPPSTSTSTSTVVTAAPAAAAPAAPDAGAPAAADAAAPASKPEPALTMEDVARLTPASDYSRFVGAGVDRGVSNAAMKKLFSDPHFNVMDGLDIYIDDYGKADPIPPAMLRKMTQSALLGLFDDEAKPAVASGAPGVDSATAAASPDGEALCEMAQSTPSDPPTDPRAPAPSDDDPDLRLQQDDGAGRRGAAPESGA